MLTTIVGLKVMNPRGEVGTIVSDKNFIAVDFGTRIGKYYFTKGFLKCTDESLQSEFEAEVERLGKLSKQENKNDMIDEIPVMKSSDYAYRSSSDISDLISDIISEKLMKKRSSDLKLAAFILCVLSTIVMGLLLIPLLWCVPMTVSIYRASKGEEILSTGFKVGTLIFVNLVAGILLLCDKM